MLGGQDADRLHTGLCRGAADPLQLNTELINCQWSPVTVVHVQFKELSPGEERKSSIRLFCKDPTAKRKQTTQISGLCSPHQCYSPESCELQRCVWGAASSWHGSPLSLSSDRGYGRMTALHNTGSYTGAFLPGTLLVVSHCKRWQLL